MLNLHKEDKYYRIHEQHIITIDLKSTNMANTMGLINIHEGHTVRMSSTPEYKATH